MARYLVISALAATALLLAACSAGGRAGQATGGNGQPLASGVVQKGAQYCIAVPSLPVNDVPEWNSPIGWAVDWYRNVSAAPAEIESVSLIDSHGFVLRGAVVYDMRHSEHPLITVDGWPLISTGADPQAWADRESIPGAVIPPGASPIETPGPNAPDEYTVVLDISAKTPAGGWAIGQQVTYRQGNSHYTIRSYTGYIVGPPGPGPGGRGNPDCGAQSAAITTAWSHL